jgi:hypothetical protein
VLLRLLACLAAAAALDASPVRAASVTDVEVVINGWNAPLAAIGCLSSGPVTQCTGTDADLGDFSIASWNLYLDSDPTVVSSFALQNDLLVAQTFTITTSVPITTWGPPITIQGSISGSVTDSNGDGALLSDASDAIYTAFIDSAAVHALLDAPVSIAAPAFDGSTFGTAWFGPTQLASTATGNIGITVRFTLSPGDLASYTAVFNMVPEPATLWMLATGLAGLSALGRQRQRRTGALSRPPA